MQHQNERSVRRSSNSEEAARGIHVLVLAQHYWPEIAATAQLLSDVCEDLVAAGNRVTVVCGQPSYRGIGEKLARHETHKGVDIMRVWSYTPARRTIPRRLVHYTSYFGASLTEAIANVHPDVCLVLSTPPLLLGCSGVLLKALRGVPFVYSVQDLYPDIAIHLGVIPEGGLAARVVDRVAASCYRSAGALITLSQGMAERLRAKGVSSDRIHVIPNWADTSAIRASSRDNSFARYHGFHERFVVQYSGNLGMSQGLEAVIGAAELLRDLPITFALVGDGNARLGLEERVRSASLRNVVFLPPQPRDHLSDLLASCDVGLVTMKRGVGRDLVPSKLYGIMAAARPVLASVELDSEVGRVLNTHQCGVVISPESAPELARGIEQMFRMTPAQHHALGMAGRRTCTELFSRAASTARYQDILRTASGRGPTSQKVREPAKIVADVHG